MVPVVEDVDDDDVIVDCAGAGVAAFEACAIIVAGIIVTGIRIIKMKTEKYFTTHLFFPGRNKMD